MRPRRRVATTAVIQMARRGFHFGRAGVPLAPAFSHLRPPTTTSNLPLSGDWRLLSRRRGSPRRLQITTWGWVALVAAAVLVMALCLLLAWGVLWCRRRYQYPVHHNGPLTFRGFESFPIVKDLKLTHVPPTPAKKTVAEKTAKPLLPLAAAPSAGGQGGGGLADWIRGLDPTDAQVVQRHREEANRSLGTVRPTYPRAPCE